MGREYHFSHDRDGWQLTHRPDMHDQLKSILKHKLVGLCARHEVLSVRHDVRPCISDRLNGHLANVHCVKCLAHSILCFLAGLRRVVRTAQTASAHASTGSDWCMPSLPKPQPPLWPIGLTVA